MSSGVAVNPACLEAFQRLKLGKKTRYIIFGLNNTNSEIVVEREAENGDWQTFIEALPKDAPRFAVYDFEFKKEDGGKRNKITFVSWSPDASPVKQKMVHASSKDALRRSLQGIAIEIQGTDYDEIAYETVLEKANKGN